MHLRGPVLNNRKYPQQVLPRLVLYNGGVGVTKGIPGLSCVFVSWSVIPEYQSHSLHYVYYLALGMRCIICLDYLSFQNLTCLLIWFVFRFILYKCQANNTPVLVLVRAVLVFQVSVHSWNSSVWRNIFPDWLKTWQRCSKFRILNSFLVSKGTAC